MNEVGNPEDWPMKSPSQGTTTLFMTDTIRPQMASPRSTAMMIRPIQRRVSAVGREGFHWSMIFCPYKIVTQQPFTGKIGGEDGSV